MNPRLLVVGLLLLALTTSPAAAQFGSLDFRILPGSEYTYFPSPVSTVPDCDLNDDLQCDFGITGNFTLQEMGVAMAAIVDADLQLISPIPVSPILPGQIVTDDRVESFLEAQQFLGIPAIAEAIAYQSSSSAGTADPLVIEFDIPAFGNSGVLIGGYDARPADGDGLVFRVTLQRIPEPCTLLLAVLPGVMTVARRRAV